MEINVLEKKKNKLVFEIKGESHGFCNALKDSLWNDKDVHVVGYNIEHPQVGIPKFILETKGKEPSAVLAKGIKRLKKENDAFLKAFKKSC